MATFLQAEWRKLVMANYIVDPAVLMPHVPAGTELDLWSNTCYVSLVGFMFQNTKVLGIEIPFHVNFEEVNLRFYVKHKSGSDWKRGVVFIKEICPRSMVSLIANSLYNEHYQTMPMTHEWQENNGKLSVEYRWKSDAWNYIKVVCGTALMRMDAGSEEEFITEHYWGYTKHSDTKTLEYQVEHPRWDLYPIKGYSIDVDFGNVYGDPIAFLSDEKPKSVFLAEGSGIKVYSGRKVQ